ncbi:zinc knuckle (CCHC-type) family protein [Rhynchospora pubera]|uniref:Zinc knuckle (CCHC-type) family protein n=1 Tax=Rhynchospora pubera TaxID=906938 RepID=A0AAV8D8F1_9POAL|nr:zinc knuckle (CCHC-type) family protein [Rhynchospora pubera]
MTEIEVLDQHFFESTKRCTQNVTHKASTGTGANASEHREMVLFTYNPLSELIWSQTEGLGIRYTSGSEFGKVSLFWSTESFNIIIPSTNDLIKEESMQLHASSEMASGRKVAGLFGAHKSLSDVLPVSVVRHHARDSRSCGQINLTNQPNPVHAQVRMSAENFENDAESTNSSVKRSAKVSHEKGAINDVVSISMFQPFCAHQENSKGKAQIANCSSLGYYHDNLQNGPKLSIKGKEKVISEKEKTAKESDDSNESVESTGSIVSKRKRPCLFSNNLKNSGLKNKRLKTEGNESSFMNWISTIANGFASRSQPAPVTPLSVARQLSSDDKVRSSSTRTSHENHAKGKTLVPFKPIGFSVLFHSLYRQNSSKKDTFALEKPSQHEDKYGLNAKHTNPSLDDIRPNNYNTRLACVVQTTVQSNVPSNNESRSSEEKRSGATNGGYLENFWITRLLPKEASSSQPPIENDAIDLNKEADDGFEERRDQNLKPNLNPILPSSKIKESDAIVSLFARRLGAIKHAKPSNLSKCKTQGNIEEKIEGPSSSNYDRRMVLWLREEDRNVREANGKGNIGLMEVGSSLAENCGTNRNSVMMYSKVLANGPIDETTAIFEAVRRLRLSRTDVMRWLKSQIQQATLDGFFLRLRLGKLKEAVGRSGYYVARINGLSGEKCLSVSIGNFTCLVECHCISNQDFLEEELKAWFISAVKGDFRLPSREELDRKLMERALVAQS